MSKFQEYLETVYSFSAPKDKVRKDNYSKKIGSYKVNLFLMHGEGRWYLSIVDSSGKKIKPARKFGFNQLKEAKSAYDNIKTIEDIK